MTTLLDMNWICTRSELGPNQIELDKMHEYGTIQYRSSSETWTPF